MMITHRWVQTPLVLAKFIVISSTISAMENSISDDRKLAKYQQLASQSIIVGCKGQLPDDPGIEAITTQIEQGDIGGIILYGHNIKNSNQLKELISHLHTAAPKGKSILIAVDQEGGNVQRLSKSKGFISTPSAFEIVQNGYPLDEVSQIYGNMAHMLQEHGINLNLAPTVDLHHPDSKAIGKWQRAYSDDPKIVTKYARIFIEAHHQHHVLTSLKHCPGHGLAFGDSHEGAVNVSLTAQPALELVPYYELIREDKVDTIMTAHIQNNNIDPEGLPATLSKVLIPRLLRQDAHYDGVVISDDLGMGAICQKYSMNLATYQAFTDATCDILLYANNAPLSCQDVDLEEFDQNFLGKNRSSYLAQQVRDGNISKERLKESYRRVTTLKNTIKL